MFFNRIKCNNCKKILEMDNYVSVDVNSKSMLYCYSCIKLINKYSGIDDELRLIAKRIHNVSTELQEHSSLCDGTKMYKLSNILRQCAIDLTNTILKVINKGRW